MKESDAAILNIAICDDNPRQMELLSSMITDNFPDEYKITRHSSPRSLWQQIEAHESNRPDAVFLDIQLGEQNGIDVAQKLQADYPGIKVIFVTGFLEYAADIFDAYPTYFLTKPIELAKVTAALNRLCHVIRQENNRLLTIPAKSGTFVLRLCDINYIESRDKIVILFKTDGGTVETRAKLDDISRQLSVAFLRGHKSYIVNMERIKCFVTDGVVLYSGEFVPISRAKYADAKQTFQGYVGRMLE